MSEVIPEWVVVPDASVVALTRGIGASCARPIPQQLEEDTPMRAIASVLPDRAEPA